MEHIEVILFEMLTLVAAVLPLLGAVMLFAQGRCNKSKRVLAWTMLLWGVSYLIRSLNFHIDPSKIDFPPFRVLGLMGGGAYILSLFLYPIEVVLPGWLNFKRIFLIFLPFIIVVGFYFLMLPLLGETIEVLPTYQLLWASIGHFNVWYRFVVLFCIFVYVAILGSIVIRNEHQYVVWRNNQYSDEANMDISWMRQYIIFFFLLLAAWVTNIVVGDIWCFNIHTLLVISCFSFLLCKGLFHQNPYPEDFFTSSQNIEEGIAEKLSDEVLLSSDTSIEHESFEMHISEYANKVRAWMDTEKPYLYKDFMLTDVSRILPLNRTYLSRVFNEGLGQNFSEFIRLYRVNYAKEILLLHPDLPLHEVAEICGFTSLATFVRAFQKVVGITPTEFKMSL